MDNKPEITLNSVDQFYFDLVSDVLANGVVKGDRTGTGTTAVFGRLGRFDLTNGRQPRLTTKPINQNPEEEMFWFMSGDPSIKMLRDKSIGIWNSWLIPGTEKYRPMNSKELANAIFKRFSGDHGAVHYTTAENFATLPVQNGINTVGKCFVKLTTHADGRKLVDVYGSKADFSSLDEVIAHAATELGIDEQVLADGSIGAGAYGPQWRRWQDTQLVSRAELPAYMNQGYKRKGVIVPDIEPYGVDEIKAALHAHLMAKGYSDSSIGDADPCMLPECGWEAVGGPGECVHVLYLDEEALINAYVEILDIPRFVMHRVVDQLANAVELLKTNPDSRRIIVSAWNPALTWKAALPPCHLYFQFVSHELTLLQRVAIYNDRTELAQRDHARKDEWSLVSWDHLHVESWAEAAADSSPEEIEKLHKDLDDRGVARRNLNCFLLLRSNDLGLGMPFNIAQYSALTHMVAQVTGLEPGELVWTAVDAHVYNDHVLGLTEQLARDSKPGIPRIKLDPRVKSIDDFNSTNVQLIDYESHPALVNKMKASV